MPLDRVDGELEDAVALLVGSAASALTAVSGPPAWAAIPSWDVMGTADHAIAPAAQEFMAARAHATVTKVDASHLSMISHAGTVTSVIEQAARATS